MEYGFKSRVLVYQVSDGKIYDALLRAFFIYGGTVPAKIKYREKPLWKESGVKVVEKGVEKELLIALEPNSILIRMKNSRQTLRLPIATAYNQAAFIQADAERSSKRTRRSVKRGKLSTGL